MCQISVVTSVYNCEAYIEETIRSVVAQTFQDWEFLLIDDCSKDRSAELIKRIAEKDGRIRLIENETNAGQVENLNKGIRMAKGKYIARLDHDDLCREDRFEKQFSYMEAHPDTGLLASRCSLLEEGEETEGDPVIEDAAELRFMAYFGRLEIPHSSYFLRKKTLEKHQIQYRPYDYAEDYGILMEMLAVSEVDFLKEPLVKYRVFPEQTTGHTSKALIYKEVTETVFPYMDRLSADGKEYAKSALKGELSTEADFQGLERFLLSFAAECGITEPDENASVQYLYRNILRWQKGSQIMWRAYTHSSLREEHRSFTKNGWKLLKQCLWKEKRRILSYGA